MTSNNGKPIWIELAEQASKETDSRKLNTLIEQLCLALDKKSEPKISAANRASK